MPSTGGQLSSTRHLDRCRDVGHATSLFLRPVHGVAATTPKARSPPAADGRERAVRRATNADVALPACPSTRGRPGPARPGSTRSEPAADTDKLVTFVPRADANAVIDAMAAGARERSATTNAVRGAQRASARSAHCQVRDQASAVSERSNRSRRFGSRWCCPDRAAGLSCRRCAPRIRTRNRPSTCTSWPRCQASWAWAVSGNSRSRSRCARSRLEPRTALPRTAAGIRVAGDLDALIRTVAVCGGAGDSLLDAVRATSADCYLTADLRHHPAAESLQQRGPALVDAAHWATEWPWLRDARARCDTLREAGTTVEARVSQIVTDPWTLQVPTPTRSPS